MYLIWVVLSVVLAIASVISLIDAVRKKDEQKKKKSWWTLATVFAMATSGAVFTFVRANNYFINGTRYKDGLILIQEDYSWLNGLAGKFGTTFIDRDYKIIVKIFNDKKQVYQFVCVTKEKYDSTDKTYEVKVHLYDDNGNRIRSMDVTEIDCDNFTDYIEMHYGEIVTEYCRSSFPIRKASIGKDIGKKEEITEESASEQVQSIDEKTNYETNSSPKETQEVVVRHVREKQQVWKERWKPCISCDRGRCRQCGGRGGYYIGEIYNVCGSCSGTGACPWCGGRGEIMETYSTYE